jgi:D-amino-acid dehydrogenase
MLPWLCRFLRAGRSDRVAPIAAQLAALNGRVYDDLVPLLRAVGLEGALKRCGALTVYESEAGFARDAAAWAMRRAHGIACEAMNGEAARAMEPALGPRVVRGVFTPDWAQLADPKELVDRLRVHLGARGVRIVQGDAAAVEAGTRPAIRLRDGGQLVSDAVVVAAGAWSALLARTLGDRALLESERGYNFTVPNPGISLGREVIFAERQFVASPLAPGLRIGGAAEFAGLDAPANYARAKALVTLAHRYLPGLDSSVGTSWMGQRPTTPDSLPVIGRSPRAGGVFYAFGHGHLGLTQSATTGRLIADLVGGRKPPIAIAGLGIERFG